MSESFNLSGHFLIAMPSMLDPHFNRAVIFVCEHNARGAFGITLNRQVNTDVAEVLNQLDMVSTGGSAYLQNKIFLGGPVEIERGFILHSPVGKWDSTLIEIDGIAVTSSLDIMRAIASGDAPQKFFLSLGYAGWGAGQLEFELAENAWLSGPVDPSIIFDTPVSERWTAAAALLGVDMSLLSNDVGHA